MAYKIKQAEDIDCVTRHFYCLIEGILYGGRSYFRHPPTALTAGVCRRVPGCLHFREQKHPRRGCFSKVMATAGKCIGCSLGKRVYPSPLMASAAGSGAPLSAAGIRAFAASPASGNAGKRFLRWILQTTDPSPLLKRPRRVRAGAVSPLIAAFSACVRSISAGQARGVPRSTLPSQATSSRLTQEER